MTTINKSKICKWLRLTFSNDKAVSFNRQASILSLVIATVFGATGLNEAMYVFAGLAASFAGITALKKG